MLNIQKYISIIPFVLFSVFLILPVVLFFSDKNAFLAFYYLVLIYMSYKLFIFVVFSIIGIVKVRLNGKKDFLSMLNQTKTPLPNHLIAIAVYKENFRTLKLTLGSIINQNYPLEKIHVSISFEERMLKNDSPYSKTVDRVKNFLSKKDINFNITFHPDNIEGEVPGAASNKNWAVQIFAKKINRANQKNFIVTIPDADTVFSENYLSDVTYKWMNHESKDRIFIQPALYKLQNNYTKLRSFTRIISTTLTLSILSSSAYKAKHRYTFSCFSLSLITLVKADFWLTSIAIDDTPFYWRPYTLFDSDWRCEVVYSPISVNAIFEHSFAGNISAQYRQFYRWGWGVITFPIALKAILYNPKIRILKKVRDTLTLFENMVLAKTAFVSLMICAFLYTHYESDLVGNIYEADFLGILIPLTFLLRTLIIPFEKVYAFIGKLLEDMIFILPIGIINLIIFGYLPYLHASLDYARRHKHYEKITWAEKE